MFKDLSFLLLTEDHTIKPSDCEGEDLNDLLFKEVILYQEQMLVTTFTVENDERTLGFYSVLSDSLQIREELFPSKSQYKKFMQNLIPHRERHLKNTPSLKIGRLGIDKTYKRKGLGSILLEGIIDEATELNKRQICRLVIVDAYRQTLPFYERLGFQYITNKDEQEDVR